MNAQPLVSCLMPVRDGGRYLGDAIASVVNQSYSNWELVIVDDHSHGCISRSALVDSGRIRLVDNEGHGIVDALNTAARYARGELLARMDADDVALRDRLQRQVDYLHRYPEIGIAGGQVAVFCDAGPVGNGYQAYQAWVNTLSTPAQIRREIFIESPIPHPTAVMRRTVFQRLGGYRHAPWAEDYDLWLRAYSAGVSMGKPAGILLRWRDHTGRLSRTSQRYARASFVRAKSHYMARTVLRNRAAVIWGAGPTGRSMFDGFVREGVNVVAFIDIHPRRIGGRKRGLPVLPRQAVNGFEEELIVCAVGVAAARPQIREYLRSTGKIEGTDFLFAA
jgi:hypothetical protein